MATIPKEAISLLGLNIQGDIGPWTTYKNIRRGTVAFLRAPPKEPPSALQTAQRRRWAMIADLWKALTAQERNDWRTAAKSANLRITGFNLFLWYQCKRDRPTLATIERKLGHALTPN